MKLFHNIMLLTGLLLAGKAGFAQVEVNEKIILTNPSASERQISGLAYPDSSGSAVNAAAVLSGKLIYDAAAGSDTLVLAFSPAPVAYRKGMEIRFKMPVTNVNGPVWININGLGIKPLYKNVSQPLDSAELLAQQMVSAVYDGNNFQVTSSLNKPCPYGFVSVNDRYCIQQNENPSIFFYDAMLHCGQLDATLCTWSEWYYACQKTSLGLNGMTDNFEWIGDASNYTTSQVNVRAASSPTCQNPASIVLVPTANKTYRCCYRKK